MRKNVEEALLALSQKPMFSTSVERFKIMNDIKSQYKDLPQPKRFSRLLGEFLSRVSTPIEKCDLIAGRCVDRELTEEEEKEFSAYLKHPDYPARKLFFASGHCTYSWEMLVREGLVGLKARVSKRLEGEKDESKRIFLESVTEAYDAMIAFSERYALAAEASGNVETARNLRRIAEGRPDSFASALQLLWIVTLIDCSYISENPTLTLGRLDKILYPLYKADIESGALTKERAAEYITDYYCKHNLIMGRGEHQVGDATNSTTFRRILNFDAPQYLLLAGTDENGELVANELTELFAQRIVPGFKNPVVVVRYVKDMDKNAPELWRVLSERAMESASLMFYNDSNVLSTFKRIGLPDADAGRYAHFGCNWCSPGDNGAWMMSAPKSADYPILRTPAEVKLVDVPYMRTRSPHSWPEDFVEILRELSGCEEGSVTIDDFYDAFFARMSEFIDRKLYTLSVELSLRKRAPSSLITFGDCFFEGSIDSAECFSAGARYHFEIQAFQMFGTVADSFIAVDQLVFIEKKTTLRKLLAAVDANFEGYPEILAMCRNAEKYGMDTPLSNKHTRRLSHTASDLVISKSRPYFEKEGLFLIPCMQSDTWHMKYGEPYGATPDGRLAYTPLADGIGPASGRDVKGPTATANSVAKLEQGVASNGTLLNQKFHPSALQGASGIRNFVALIRSYFDQKGMHMQFNVVTRETLLDAQKNPEKYKTLVVRVAGYSALFTTLSKSLQDDIINRTEQGF